jgi:trehalose/maltose hydrolase-like predicted phosphorylase
MAAWVLRCASGVLQLLSGERRQSLSEELQIRDDELRRWDDISRRLFVPFHGDGIISQFEGYAELQEFRGKPSASGTATSSGSTASSRPTATTSIATRRASRPTC